MVDARLPWSQLRFVSRPPSTTIPRAMAASEEWVANAQRVIEALHEQVQELKEKISTMETRQHNERESKTTGWKKVISKHETPTKLGSKDKYRAWAKKMKSLAKMEDKDLAKLIEWSETATGEIDPGRIDESGLVNADDVNNLLYQTLMVFTEEGSEANHIVENTAAENGAEAWRRLALAYDPITDAANNDAMATIHNPPRATAKTCMATIEGWERMIRLHEERTKTKALTESSRRALLLRIAPKEVAEQVAMHEVLYDTYEKAKNQIRKYCERNTPQPMEIGGLDQQDAQQHHHHEGAGCMGELYTIAKGSGKGQGGKDGKGKGQLLCYNCQKPGHKSAECKAPCGICGVKGHISRDCPKRRDGKAKGGKGKRARFNGATQSLEEEEEHEEEGEDTPIEDAGGLEEYNSYEDLCVLEEDANEESDPWRHNDPWKTFMVNNEPITKVRATSRPSQRNTPEEFVSINLLIKDMKGMLEQKPGQRNRSDSGNHAQRQAEPNNDKDEENITKQETEQDTNKPEPNSNSRQHPAGSTITSSTTRTSSTTSDKMGDIGLMITRMRHMITTEKGDTRKDDEHDRRDHDQDHLKVEASVQDDGEAAVDEEHGGDEHTQVLMREPVDDAGTGDDSEITDNTVQDDGEAAADEEHGGDEHTQALMREPVDDAGTGDDSEITDNTGWGGHCGCHWGDGSTWQISPGASTPEYVEHRAGCGGEQPDHNREFKHDTIEGDEVGAGLARRRRWSSGRLARPSQRRGRWRKTKTTNEEVHNEQVKPHNLLNSIIKIIWAILYTIMGKHQAEKVENSMSLADLVSIDDEGDHIIDVNPLAAENDRSASTKGMLEICVDSGAVEVVAPREFAAEYPVKPSAGSKRGVRYRAANGGTVPNEGEKEVEMITELGELRRMRFQVAKVTKPLAAAGRITANGHKIVLDEDESYIEHKATGTKTPLYKKNGVFVMRVWVKPKSGQAKPTMSGFSRQGRT